MSLLQRAVQAALHEVEGTYGIAVLCRDEPDTLVVARKGSPLIIGVGEDEYVVASDASAIVEHTTQVIYLNDNEMAVLRPTVSARCTIDDIEVSPVIEQLEHKLEEYELGDYEHYMLKEIFEQPSAIRNCLRGRVEQQEGADRAGRHRGPRTRLAGPGGLSLPARGRRGMPASSAII